MRRRLNRSDWERTTRLNSAHTDPVRMISHTPNDIRGAQSLPTMHRMTPPGPRVNPINGHFFYCDLKLSPSWPAIISGALREPIGLPGLSVTTLVQTAASIARKKIFMVETSSLRFRVLAFVLQMENSPLDNLQG